VNKENKNKKYGTVSIPTGVLEEIDNLVKELRFWPSRGAFVREACIEKVRREQDRLKKSERSASGEKVLEKERGERQND